MLAAGTNFCDLSLSPSGRWLAASLQDGEEVWIWDVSRRVRVERRPLSGRAEVRFKAALPEDMRALCARAGIEPPAEAP